MPVETFAALAGMPFITHGFTQRCPADTRVDAFEQAAVRALGLPSAYASAEQTHGNGVAVVTQPVLRVAGVDALATRMTGLPLVIRCADCAAVFIVDRATPAIALIHSGKKGTLANVVGATVATMREAFQTRPEDCLAVISPSIGPCHYEMDIWSAIEGQLQAAGVGEVANSRTCTACHLDRYYSYRAEKGQTGRMLAVLALTPVGSGKS